MKNSKDSAVNAQSAGRTSRTRPATSLQNGYKTKPAVIPIPTLYVKAISAITPNAGTTSLKSSNGMRVIGVSISKPTKISAGP